MSELVGHGTGRPAVGVFFFVLYPSSLMFYLSFIEALTCLLVLPRACVSVCRTEVPIMRVASLTAAVRIYLHPLPGII